MAIALVAVLAGVAVVSQIVIYHHRHNAQQAAMTPTVEVTESASALPIAEAQAAPAGSSPIIALHDNHESIVGELARIPAENEQITEIKAVSDIDNNAGRELLSIISKY